MFESYVILYITKTFSGWKYSKTSFESYVILYITKTIFCVPYSED